MYELIDRVVDPIVGRLLNLIPERVFVWASCQVERIAVPELHANFCSIHSRTR